MKILKQRGFTLVELMVAVGIIVVLAGLAIPGVVRSRHNVNEALAAQTLGTVSTAMQMYYNEKGDFPPEGDSLAGALFNYLPSSVIRDVIGATTTSGKTYRGYHFDYTKPGICQYAMTATVADEGISEANNFSIDANGFLQQYAAVDGKTPPASPSTLPYDDTASKTPPPPASRIIP